MGTSTSRLRRLAEQFGFAYPEGGAPAPGAARRSRYGLLVSPRLDHDVDELRSRLEALERGGTHDR